MTRRNWVLVGLAVAVALVIGGGALAALLVGDDDEDESARPVTRGPAAAVPIAPPGVPPRPAAPSAQEAAEAEIAAAWTYNEIIAALRNPVTVDRKRVPGSSAPAPPLTGETRARGQRTEPPPTVAPRAGKAAARACRQPRVVKPHPQYPYSRSCYRAPLNVPPGRVVGEMLFQFRQRGRARPPQQSVLNATSSCTGTVAWTGNDATPGNESVLVTAGHCIGVPASGMPESDGTWQPIENLWFVPSFTLRSWVNRRFPSARAAARWLKQRAWYPRVYPGTRNPVGFMPTPWKNSANWHFDFAALVMAPRTFGGRQVSISRRLGGVGVTMAGAGLGRKIRSLGYPGVRPFKGDKLFECAASVRRLGDDLIYDPPTPTVLGIGCDMTGGSSGGPWLADTNRNGTLEIVSVNSYGPPNIMFGPNLNARDHWPTFDAARRT